MTMLIRRGIPLLTAFLLGASLVGVASGHKGFSRLLHSQHSDSINGRLRAKHFRLSRPLGSYVVIAPAAIQPLDAGFDDDSNCALFSREPAFVEAPVGCELVAQVAAPNHSMITKVTWDFQFVQPTTEGTVDLKLISYDDFGINPSEPFAGEEREVGPGCDQGCKLNFGAFPMNGVNPVIPQRRTYSLFLRSDDVEIRTTRILVTTKVRRPGPF